MQTRERERSTLAAFIKENTLKANVFYECSLSKCIEKSLVNPIEIENKKVITPLLHVRKFL